MLIPIFPLNTVLFPGGSLKLRVFERRYLDMISDCLRQNSGFGVCLIKQGNEVGSAAEPHAVGTMAFIADWEQRPDGLLGVTVHGDARFVLERHEVGPHQLLQGDVRVLSEPEPQPLPERFEPLSGLLQRILEQLDGPYRDVVPQYDDACWVGCRLAEILPLPLRLKQELLEMQDPLERLLLLQQSLARANC